MFSLARAESQVKPLQNFSYQSPVSGFVSLNMRFIPERKSKKLSDWQSSISNIAVRNKGCPITHKVS